MKRTITAWFKGTERGWIVACAFVSVLAAAVSADTLQAAIDTFFTKLSAEFDRVAASPALRSSRAAPIDAIFLRELRRHQVINTLARADAKGRLVTKLVRMKEPDHARKNVKDERWFSPIMKGDPEFFAVVRDTGRYYLILSKPVMGTKTKAAKGPLGVAMMKIDLWDCFHKLSRSTEEPFLIRLNKRNFYSNRWKKEYTFDEMPLAVRGAAVTLRIQKIAAPPPPAVAAPAVPDTTKITAALSSADSVFAAKRDAERARARKILLVAVSAGALLLLVLIVKTISWIKHKMVLRSIDRNF